MTVNKYTVNKRKFHTHSLYMDCVGMTPICMWLD